MDGIQMEPIGKYKADRNGSAKAAAWRNMVDQDLDDVAFLADSEKAREAGETLGGTPVAVCSQRRALCLTVLVVTSMFASALLVVLAAPQPECPCANETSIFGSLLPSSSDATSAANKERIASNGAVFPWRGARLPTFVVPKHYSLWLHPNLTTGELKGEVSIDLRVDRDTTFVVLNVRDMNVTERALFKSGGSMGPKVAKVLDFLPADQTYIEFKEKLRRKYNYTLSLRFITKLDKSDTHRGFYLAGNHKQRCAVTRFWLTNARSAFPCFDEPQFRATFHMTIVRDRFHVSLTNMPIVATEEAGFYLGHRLLQDEFAISPPMAPHMASISVCRLQRRAAPPLSDYNYTTIEVPTKAPDLGTKKPEVIMNKIADSKWLTTESPRLDGSTEDPLEELVLPPPEISLYSDRQLILDESGPLLDWIQKTVQHFAFELNTSYPLPKLDIVVIEGGAPYSEGWGLIVLSPTSLSDTKIIARLLAQQWFGGLVSPRWWSAAWLLEALTSVLVQKAPAPTHTTGFISHAEPLALLLEHLLPALRLDSSNSVRAVSSPRLERADIESASDELSLHKGTAIVSMAIEAAGEDAGRAALAKLLRDHRSASADARDLWNALKGGASAAWDGWCSRPGYPLLIVKRKGSSVHFHQERFIMSADPPEYDDTTEEDLLTADLRASLDELFYEPENITETIEDENATTTAAPTTTTTRKPTTKPSKIPPPKWVIPVTFVVGPLAHPEFWKSNNESLNGTWYDLGNDTKSELGSKWAENVTHLIWMNDTDMEIPDLGKHKWVRYNVGARGLYRVAIQDDNVVEAAESAALLYDNADAAERALMLDDAFVLCWARKLSAGRALALAMRLSREKHWAAWMAAAPHLSRWRALLRLAAARPRLQRALRTLHPAPLKLQHSDDSRPWLSGALLSAGVEWENEVVTKQAVDLFKSWMNKNQSIPDIYQEAVFTAGVRSMGEKAWNFCWNALLTSLSAARPLYSHSALLSALAAPDEDWLFWRWADTVLSPSGRRSGSWGEWTKKLLESACRWRGEAGAIALLQRRADLPPAALLQAASCLNRPQHYHKLKELYGSSPGGAAALDVVALNAAWLPKADRDLLAYFNATVSHTQKN